MKYCKKCRSENNDDSHFCSFCGCGDFVDDYSYFDSIPRNEDTEDTNNLLNLDSDIIKKKLLRVYLPIALTVLLIIVFFCTYAFWLFILIVPLGIYSRIGIAQSRNTCPKCNTWNSLKTINTTVTNRVNTTVREKRTARTYTKEKESAYVKKMDQYQETEYYVDVPAETVHYDVELKCEKCGYVTTRKQRATYKK